MCDLAKRMNNTSLSDQCQTARSKYRQVAEMMHHRQELTINQVDEEVEWSDAASWLPSESSSLVTVSGSAVSWRRRSYAGQPSIPLYSPSAAAFKDHVDQDDGCGQYLITTDLSTRVVTCLPKGLASSSTLRSSHESLRDSRDNLTSSTSPSYQVLPEQPVEGILNQAQPGYVNCSKANRSRRTHSIITGSSESLPSMPEEEEPFDSSIDSALPASQSLSRQSSSTAHSPESSAMSCSPPVSSSHSNSLPSYHSMADLRVSDENIRRHRTLANIATELIQTEKDYVDALNFVIENYIPEMLREDVPQALRGKRNIIFGNLEKIHSFHRNVFLEELEACRHAPLQVCHCFTQHASQFYLYALYNKNKPKSDELMNDYGTTFFRGKQLELQDRMDLSSYLLKPVQRVGKYALLLKELLKECRANGPEYSELRAAHKMVCFQLRHGNDLLAMDALRDFDVNLQEQGRLLRQGEFLVWHGKKRCWRQVFLFEDLVLFSKTRQTQSGHDVYFYKSSFKTSDLGLTENVGNIGTRFEIWFRKRTTSETYTLQAADVSMKVAWTREVSSLLWRQAIKNRENRLAEMSRMGIGNKPNIDLKPSKNNIQDRFVNISLSSRSIPRTRNSISVASFPRVNGANPRPHSLISLGGSSSSNSSGGYSGSATTNRTMSSTESGIVADMSSPLDCLLEITSPVSPVEDSIEESFESEKTEPAERDDGGLLAPEEEHTSSEESPLLVDSGVGDSCISVDFPLDSSRCLTVVETITTDITASTMEDACTQTTLKRGSTRMALAPNSDAPSGV